MNNCELKNKSLSSIRGFNYHPSFAGHGIPRWLDRYSAATVEDELRCGKAHFPWLNTIRIWLSLDAWRDNRLLFLSNLQKEIEINRKLGLKVILMLFNGITNIPDYGCLSPTDADRILKKDGGNNLKVLYLDYVQDIAELYAKDPVVVIWDLCNEPGLHYKNEGDHVREAIFYLLEKSAVLLREHGVMAPIGVGNFGPLRDDEKVVGFVDCLLTHRYYVPHYMKIEEFIANVHETMLFANDHNLPWCVTECSWGAWNDEERAKNIPLLEEFLKIGAGVVPYALYESPAMDAHGKNAGVHYGWGAPEDLCFIRTDGSLRKGHEKINDIMNMYPVLESASVPSHVAYDSFRPGKEWLDTDGVPIQAHGGCILQVGDTYYWYGENKNSVTTYNSRGGARTPLIGVSCYTSSDLYNWMNQGVVLSSASNQDGHELSQNNVLERPKVVYNKMTGKYVMWFHLDSEDYTWAKAGIAIADSPLGPFEYLGSMRPSGCELRDMTLFKDDDGKAYLIYTSENNETIHISLLDQEYTQPVGEPHRILIHMVREAPVLFKQNGYYFLITSACTGWNDNRAMLSTAEDVMGKWLTLRGGECLAGDIHGAETTFSSQGTFALKITQEGCDDQIIFMADRWNQHDLGKSRYVWLPVYVKERFATIEWQDSWRLFD